MRDLQAGSDPTQQGSTRCQMTRGGSPQLVQQSLRLFQIGCVEALSEPAVDRSEEVAGFGAAAVVAEQTREAGGGTQFPHLGFLLLGDPERFAIQLLGGFGIPLPKQQLALLPVQLCRQPALTRSFDDL